MKNLLRLSLVLALLAAIAALAVAACSSGHGRHGASQAPAERVQASPTAGNNSPGNSPSGSGQSGRAVVTQGLPFYDGVPSTGLNSVREGHNPGPRAGVREGLAPWSSSRRGDGGPSVHGNLQFRYLIRDEHGGHAAAPAAPSIPRLSATEELWIIQRLPANDETAPPAPAPDDSFPGCGALMTRLPAAEGQTRDVPVPLKHTDVRASISGFISTVDVVQQFRNPFESKIEALYVFPLPDNAAVSEFVMTIGDRHIRGIIRERAEAEKVYYEARAAGHVASLLTQERPNVFTQHVANIEPGRAIDISIRYYGTLPYTDGAYEFAFPMVVGPRFNPPGTTDGIGAVGRAEAGASGQSAEVQYLRPQERSGHDIALRVEIDAGVSLEEVTCRTHRIEVNRPSSSEAVVTLAPTDTIPNRDFVLRIGVAGEAVKSTLIARADDKGDGGYFALMLVPPRDLARLKRGPVEMVFVLDSSGSMSGRPMEQAKAAIERGLQSLAPGDSFQLINFSNSASQLGGAPLEATPANIRRGLDHLQTVDAGGGTMMMNGLRASLDFPHDPERLRFVTFLTDGFIGNESEILTALHDRLGATRVFSFGIGTSVNRYLIESMARVGTGVAAYVNLADSSAEIMDAFFERVSHPALADVAIDWGGAQVSDVAPARVPDLFVGRPVVLTGRYRGVWNGTVRVSGRAAGAAGVQEIHVPTDTPITGVQASALPQVWARMRIGELADRATWDADPSLPEQVRRLALDYSLMSSYTAFVAVDSLSKTAGEFGTTVAVPVPVPEGVRYETTVSERPR